MTNIQAALLGLVQGLTEFLPVSSSGHLVLGQHILGLTEADLFFDSAAHAGTLLAVLWVFRAEIAAMIKGALGRDREGRRLLLLVFIGSVPTAAMGLLLEDYFTALFSSVTAVGIALIITGIILTLSRLAPARGKKLSEFGPLKAILIGIAQGLAITPGISRSGATISCALLLGMDRALAARFSFVLSIPAVGGAFLLQLLKHHAAPQSVAYAPVALGALTAALSGYLALKLLLRLVEGGKLHLFAYYCWALGGAALAWQLLL